VLLIKKWFTEIVLVYLPVGHTYELVDGILFAKIRKLKKTQKSFQNSSLLWQKLLNILSGIQRLSGIERHGSHHSPLIKEIQRFLRLLLHFKSRA
jgi:hypothetical protein